MQIWANYIVLTKSITVVNRRKPIAVHGFDEGLPVAPGAAKIVLGHDPYIYMFRNNVLDFLAHSHTVLTTYLGDTCPNHSNNFVLLILTVGNSPFFNTVGQNAY